MFHINITCSFVKYIKDGYTCCTCNFYRPKRAVKPSICACMYIRQLTTHFNKSAFSCRATQLGGVCHNTG